MHIKRLQLKNYRNYGDVDILFEPGINIIYGENAKGKTNLIESVYMSATSKSHRLSKDSEIVRLGEAEGHIHMFFEKDGTDENIDILLKSRGNKKIAVNKVPIKRLNELFGLLHVIMFSPEDLGLIKLGPKERRRFVDKELSQLNPVYMFYLSQYHKVLKQRNKLLKDYSERKMLEPVIDVFDQQLADYGVRIIEMRESFIRSLNPVYAEKHKQISGGREEVRLVYDKHTEAEEFHSKLKKNLDRDMAMKTTSAGPHRDDLQFMMDDLDLRKFGSQGQQRTAALSLKLSEIALVKENIDDTPVLLLDDVLSELDHNRQQHLIHHLEDIQTFITCTGVEDFIIGNMNKYQLFEVKDNQVIKMT